MELTCKSCGSELVFNKGQKTVVCEFCGLEQTLPKADDSNLIELLKEANEFRKSSCFDVAKKRYESIIAKYPNDNEAYWCKLLCEYGIEYVDDMKKEKKIPTCHRTLVQSIFDNKDYKLIISRATPEEKAIYESEAKEIDSIQKEIIEKAKKEAPFDIFICYKESVIDGDERTPDSKFALSIYNALTENGYKVFFSRMTLKERMGEKYEPIIYSALMSAKVMLHVTTSITYTNAPWVRNEWSRFLEFSQKDKSKIIIPCLAMMSAKDLPDELAKIQSADIMDVSFLKNLLDTLNKKFGRKQKTQPQPTPAAEPVTSTRIEQNVTNQPQNTPYTESYGSSDDKEIDRFFKRIPYFIKDDEWDKVDEYAEKILDRDPTNAQAYVCKLQAEYKVRTMPELQNLPDTFEESYNYKKAISYADSQLKKTLVGYISFIKERNENARIDKLYNQALTDMRNATTEEECQQCIKLFESVKNYKDSKILITKCKDKVQEIKKNTVYREARSQMNRKLVIGYKKAIELFKTIRSHRDAEDKISDCERAIREIETRLENERKAEVYERARTLKRQQTLESYTEAAKLFGSISQWKDSAQLAADCRNAAKECKIRIENERKDVVYFNATRKIAVPTIANYEEAIRLLETVRDWKDSKTKIEEWKKWIKDKKKQEEDARKDRIYIEAKAYMPLNNVASLENAIKLFESVRDWRDSAQQIASCKASIAKIKQKEEEARIKRENERKICLDLIAQLPEALNRDYLSETRKDVRNRLATLKAKDREIRSDIAKGNEIIAQIKSLEAELKQLEEKRNACMDEKNTLKFFAIKRKSELDHEIVECTKKISELSLKIKELKNKPESAFNSQSMKRILDKNATGIAELDKELSRLENAKVKEDIIFELENYEYGREYLSSNKSTASSTSYGTSSAKPSSSSVGSVVSDPSKLQVGDIYKFGSYYQSNETTKEPIEWKVLAKDGNKVLLLSKYALDRKPYNDFRTTVIWEKSSVRSWLNSYFLYAAFTDSERELIPTVKVSADSHPVYETRQGSDTQDKVFLLSINEVEKYFKDIDQRVCEMTEYAKKRTSKSDSSVEENGDCDWLLRTLSKDYVTASLICCRDISYKDCGVQYEDCGIRPVIWMTIGDSVAANSISTVKPTSTMTTPNTAPRPTTQTTTNTTPRSTTQTTTSTAPRPTTQASSNNWMAVSPLSSKASFAEYSNTVAQRSVQNLYIGSKCKFGRYYDYGCDKNPISWIIIALTKDKKHALLLSEYGIDAQPYHEYNADVAWDTCSLRSWLHKDFMDEAFNNEEKQAITSVRTSVESGCVTNIKKEVIDKIFLLNPEEVRKFVLPIDLSYCKPTNHTRHNLFGSYSTDEHCGWWLRARSYFNLNVDIVDCLGHIDTNGDSINSRIYAVRPAMWVKIEALTNIQQ